MTRRLDLYGRLLLIVLGSVLFLGAGSVALLILHDRARPRPPVSFPRLRQVAGIVDLAARLDAPSADALLRAANGVDLTARMGTSVPTVSDLRRAPRLEARLRGFMRTDTPVVALTSSLFRPRRAPVEGFLAQAIARLPDGRILTLTANGRPDEERPRFFGLPASLWMGTLAAIVAVLALVFTARETRPLRDLVHATQQFDGTSVTVVGTPVGAADIRRTSSAVAEMQRRVIGLLGERSLMIGAVSHDLRTLLTRMRLRVAALRDETARHKLEGDLEGMDAMLADALAFARGTTSTMHGPIDLADIAAAEAAEREARSDRCAVETDLHDAPCVGDAHALRRVVANLLDNAEKYGGGRVRLSVTTEQSLACLRVEDDGPGIPADQRLAVLTPYHRGDDPGQRRIAGSGLGLAIVQQIVRAHGGTVTISDSSLGGATLIVKIDCRQVWHTT